ncbi:hypothetical protein AVEN_180873-1 [Araneus ventricosus]|uniref:Uncharacterized protein n=1 Tax=Araneus ventricosus TaxID=182803 RepID=A0A4Y2NR01_ARAVE|nr:hypothetical protein AVEN_180873-1 [Araneus ventricosus]
MLNSVCCIIDVDGFDIRNYDEYGQYTTEFLVRELGYIRVDPNYHYIPKSYRFDLRQKVNPARCPPKVRQTLNYQSRNVIGLTVLPRPDERDAIDYDCLKKVLQDIYDFCRRTDVNVVAYKGGDKERKLLESLNILCVDLQGFGCPSYQDLVRTRKVYSELQDCGYHTEFRGNSLIHCPKAEVTAYRDWFMMNYKRFR